MKVSMKMRNPKANPRMSHHRKTRTRKMIVRRKGSLWHESPPESPWLKKLQFENKCQPAEGVDLHLILLLKKAEASAVAVVAAAVEEEVSLRRVPQRREDVKKLFNPIFHPILILTTNLYPKEILTMNLRKKSDLKKQPIKTRRNHPRNLALKTKAITFL